MNGDEIKDYDKVMLFSTPSAVQLCELMKSIILNTPYLMNESSVHTAIEYFKASFKKNIELNQNLLESEKENQKNIVDAFCLMCEENLKIQFKSQGRLIQNI